MADFAKRQEVTVSTMGKVHNPTGEGVPAVSASVKANKHKKMLELSPGMTPPPSPAGAHLRISAGHHPHKNSVNGEPPETEVKEEGSSRRNITRKKSDGAAAGGKYDSRNKKHGGAGKGVWTDSLDGSDSIPILKLDEKDPLYDDFDDNAPGKAYVLVSSDDKNAEDEAGAVRPNGFDPVANKAVYGPMLTLSEFKFRVSEALLEYFDSEDHLEFINCIQELKCAQYHPEIVKRAVSLSLDKTSREKELVSRLLSILHPDPLNDDAVKEGFGLLLDSLDDLCIDTPDAKSIAGTFLARAVVDEVVTPAFVSSGDHSHEEVFERAMRLLSRDHCGVRLEHVWGPGDGRSVGELKVVMDQLLKEYLLSRELDEGARCIREMNAPHFHHELVKRGFTVAIDERCEDGTISANLDAMAALFAFLVDNSIVNKTNVVKGMHRLRKVLEDIKLDVSPKAPEMLQEFTDLLSAKGALPDTFDAMHSHHKMNGYSDGSSAQTTEIV